MDPEAILPAFYGNYLTPDDDDPTPADDDDDLSRSTTVASSVRYSDVHLLHQHGPEIHSGSTSNTLNTKSASKRFQVAKWLQQIIGTCSIPDEPSEEEFCLSLSDGSVLLRLLSKVNATYVQETSPTSSPFGSVRMFISMAADLQLPVFEISDLDQGIHRPSSVEKIVDCLLSVKSFYESSQRKDILLQKGNDGMTSSIRAWDLPSTQSTDYSGEHLPKSPHQPRKRWVIPENENVNEANTLTATADGSAQHKTLKPKAWNFFPSDENDVPSRPGSNSIYSQNIRQFQEFLKLKTKEESHKTLAPGNSEIVSLITGLVGQKQEEDIAVLVDAMLKKVIEEFELRLVRQNEHVAKLKKTLKEHVLREERLTARARVLETLAAGTGEEVKIVSGQLKQLKMEKRQAEKDKLAKQAQNETLLKERNYFKAMTENLRKELDQLKENDQERLDELLCEKQDIERKLQAEVKDLESQVEDARWKTEALEKSSLAEMQILRMKHQHYSSFINSLFPLFKDMKSTLQGLWQEVSQMQKVQQKESEALCLQLYGIAQAASGYHRVLAENRQLYNEVQDLKGNIRVYCRVRPFLPGQVSKLSSVEFVGDNGDILISNPAKQGKENRRIFNFNKVFEPSATQEEVFMDTRPLIRSVLDGYNVCIFAYGQTGSGKTYTMTGPNSSSEDDWGVNYRALRDLFEISQCRKDTFKYEVGVQMIEIYNEQVRDLLFIDAGNRKLEIRNYSQINGLNVPEACMVPVSSSLDVFELMKIGQKNRAVGATALNDRSSRSHSVLTVHVQGIDLESGSVIRGCLHLVDLAGSERVAKSEATGDRLKEAQHINKSLSALGDVVSALAQKNVHVPYRNSKLTQLLQDSLGGQAKTLMFVHINPDVESYGETISTLKFAERVASVELGAARSNKESHDVWDLKEQVSFLKEVIAKKDSEISRLQSINTVAIESGSGFERSKLRLFNNFSSSRNTAEVNQRLRRQTVDASHKEKQGAFQVVENVRSQDFETSLVSTSPTRSRPPLEEEDVECLKSVTIISMDGSEASDGSEIRTTDALLTTSMKNQDSTNEDGMLSREWHGRLHSSSESSLFGIASVDDLSCAWDLVHTGKCCELMNVSPLAGALKDSDISLNSLNLCTSSSLEGAVQIKLETSDDSMQEKDLDISGGLSDGNVSQADTEGSLSSIGEEIVWTKKTDIKAGKATLCYRKSSVSQLATSLRGTSLNNDSAITYPRRHSAAGSPWGSEWVSKHSRQKPPLFELKHAGQDRVVSGSEAGISQSSQHMMKPPTRRL